MSTGITSSPPRRQPDSGKGERGSSVPSSPNARARTASCQERRESWAVKELSTAVSSSPGRKSEGATGYARGAGPRATSWQRGSFFGLYKNGEEPQQPLQESASAGVSATTALVDHRESFTIATPPSQKSRVLSSACSPEEEVPPTASAGDDAQNGSECLRETLATLGVRLEKLRVAGDDGCQPATESHDTQELRTALATLSQCLEVLRAALADTSAASANREEARAALTVVANALTIVPPFLTSPEPTVSAQPSVSQTYAQSHSPQSVSAQASRRELSGACAPDTFAITSTGYIGRDVPTTRPRLGSHHEVSATAPSASDVAVGPDWKWDHNQPHDLQVALLRLEEVCRECKGFSNRRDLLSEASADASKCTQLAPAQALASMSSLSTAPTIPHQSSLSNVPLMSHRSCAEQSTRTIPPFASFRDSTTTLQSYRTSSPSSVCVVAQRDTSPGQEQTSRPSTPLYAYRTVHAGSSVVIDQGWCEMPPRQEQLPRLGTPLRSYRTAACSTGAVIKVQRDLSPPQDLLSGVTRSHSGATSLLSYMTLPFNTGHQREISPRPEHEQPSSSSRSSPLPSYRASGVAPLAAGPLGSGTIGLLCAQPVHGASCATKPRLPTALPTPPRTTTPNSEEGSPSTVFQPPTWTSSNPQSDSHALLVLASQMVGSLPCRRTSRGRGSSIDGSSPRQLERPAIPAAAGSQAMPGTSRAVGGNATAIVRDLPQRILQPPSTSGQSMLSVALPAAMRSATGSTRTTAISPEMVTRPRGPAHATMRTLSPYQRCEQTPLQRTRGLLPIHFGEAHHHNAISVAPASRERVTEISSQRVLQRETSPTLGLARGVRTLQRESSPLRINAPGTLPQTTTASLTAAQRSVQYLPASSVVGGPPLQSLWPFTHVGNFGN